ncbi:unnamed protein product [Adineta steineri]|uniref:Methyltransferase type 11 domain-containing protein n=1 Tax=Adineta steineri TaxID=433720 RepID=A0A819IGN9_9BILA|nr:unnamed protein product [Adineta steineri]CAF3917987.1 unnamed protein product [Adineta steineri]
MNPIIDASTTSSSSVELIEAMNEAFKDTGELASNTKNFYNFMAKYFQKPDWAFMNYGFAILDNDVHKTILRNGDVDDLNPALYCVQLYSAAISDTNLEGLDVIEIGCGRGGGSAWIARNFNVKSMVGIDYSENAIEFCQKCHGAIPNLRFEHGNAECLPYSNNTFDIVINVESSHCYPSMERFLSEVYRVLKPGGYFLWTDFRQAAEKTVLLEQFKTSGLEMIEKVDITENVDLGFDKGREARLSLVKEFPNELQTKLKCWIDTSRYKNGETFFLRCRFKKPLTHNMHSNTDI